MILECCCQYLWNIPRYSQYISNKDAQFNVYMTVIHFIYHVSSRIFWLMFYYSLCNSDLLVVKITNINAFVYDYILDCYMSLSDLYMGPIFGFCGLQ